jgi:ABC-type bacteriocin/lantibiotic exporter with double-glycine peptidase domain
LTLVIAAATPCLFLSGYLEMKTLSGLGNKTRKAYEESGQIVQQSVSNMRTIASLTRENTFKELYHDAIKSPHRIAVKGSAISALGFGLSQCLLFLVYALAFWYGGQLVASQEYTQVSFFLYRIFYKSFCIILKTSKFRNHTIATNDESPFCSYLLCYGRRTNKVSYGLELRIVSNDH